MAVARSVTFILNTLSISSTNECTFLFLFTAETYVGWIEQE
jgi:hypothetical protein